MIAQNFTCPLGFCFTSPLSTYRALVFRLPGFVEDQDVWSCVFYKFCSHDESTVKLLHLYL